MPVLNPGYSVAESGPPSVAVATEPGSNFSDQRLEHLDGLRGIAIAMVLVWHFFIAGVRNQGEPVSLLVSLLSMSWSGVDLFFVLSGFLITGILVDHGDSENYFKTFYLRRACRILPLYVLLLAAFLVARELWSPQRVRAAGWLFGDAMPFWTYLTFTQNFAMAESGRFGGTWLSPTWSLAVEEQFYLLLPFVIRFAPREYLVRIFTTLIVAAPLFRIGGMALYPQPGAAGFFLMPGRADALLLGGLAACWMRNPSAVRELFRWRYTLYAALAILVAGFMVMSFWMPHESSVNMTIWGRSWLALLYFAVLMVVLLNPNGFLGKFFRLWPLRKLGLISYGVYLIHYPVLGMTFLLSGSALARQIPLLLKLLALLLTLALATVLYRTFEKRFLDFGRRHAYGPRRVA